MGSLCGKAERESKLCPTWMGLGRKWCVHLFTWYGRKACKQKTVPARSTFWWQSHVLEDAKAWSICNGLSILLHSLLTCIRLWQLWLLNWGPLTAANAHVDPHTPALTRVVAGVPGDHVYNEKGCGWALPKGGHMQAPAASVSPGLAQMESDFGCLRKLCEPCRVMARMWSWSKPLIPLFSRMTLVWEISLPVKYST